MIRSFLKDGRALKYMKTYINTINLTDLNR